MVKSCPFEDDVLLNLKKSSYCLITAPYFRQSASAMLVEARMSSASSPIQYSSVLTCLSLLSSARSDASRNCSNLRFQRGHSSGVLKSNGEGGCRQMLAIALLTPCTMSRMERFTLLGKTQQFFKIHTEQKHCYRNCICLHSTQHIMVVYYIR